MIHLEPRVNSLSSDESKDSLRVPDEKQKRKMIKKHSKKSLAQIQEEETELLLLQRNSMMTKSQLIMKQQFNEKSTNLLEKINKGSGAIKLSSD